MVPQTDIAGGAPPPAFTCSLGPTLTHRLQRKYGAMSVPPLVTS
jgi:hypothetical protein